MIQIGFVGLDTSHPASFIKLLNAMSDVCVSAVYDDGAVRSEEYTREFCARHNCRRFQSLDEMAGAVDAAMILGVNWDRHLEHSAPFLRAGRAVYVDKPLCGNATDIARFETLVQETGAPFLSGSGWRFNDKVRTAAKECAYEEVTDIYVESCLPAFFYGIHAVELALGLLGPGFTKVQTVCWDEDKAGVLLALEHSSGRPVMLKMAPSQQYWRGALYHLLGQWRQVTFDAADIHGAVCETFVETARRGQALVDFAGCSESVRLLLAARHSHQLGSAVPIHSAVPVDIRFDGAAFLEHYRQQI